MNTYSHLDGAAVKIAPAYVRDLGEADPKDAFFHYLRTGQVKRGAKAALQFGTDAEGGYLVPDDEYRRIIAKRNEASIPRIMGASQYTTNRDVFNIPVEDASLGQFTIVAEEGDITGAEQEPAFAQVPVVVYKFLKLIKVSEELLEDDNAGLEIFLEDALGRALALTENHYALAGTGAGEPKGVLAVATLGKTFAANNAITPAEVNDLRYALPRPYRIDDNVAWVMQNSTEGHLAGIQGDDFIFQNRPYGTGGKNIDTLLNHPVFNSNEMAAIGSNAKSILFANWRYFAVVTNRGLRIKRLTELYAKNGQVGILASIRFGCAPLLAEAFKYGQHPA